MPKTSIDRLYDKQQTDDRFVVKSESGPNERIITVEGDTVRIRHNDDGDRKWNWDMTRAMANDADRAAMGEEYKDPTEVTLTIEQFRSRIIETLDHITAVILTPRESDGYEMDSGIIDELHDNPVTGDRVVFNMIAGGSMTYERTIIRDGDTIRFEENDLRYTIGQFRDMILEKLCDGCLAAISLANRNKAKRAKTI